MPSAPGSGSTAGTSVSIRVKAVLRGVGVAVGEAATGDPGGPGRVGVPPPGVPTGVPAGVAWLAGVAGGAGRVGVAAAVVGVAACAVVAVGAPGVGTLGGSGVGVGTVPPHAASNA